MLYLIDLPDCFVLHSYMHVGFVAVQVVVVNPQGQVGVLLPES